MLTITNKNTKREENLIERTIAVNYNYYNNNNYNHLNNLDDLSKQR